MLRLSSLVQARFATNSGGTLEDRLSAFTTNARDGPVLRALAAPTAPEVCPPLDEPFWSNPFVVVLVFICIRCVSAFAEGQPESLSGRRAAVLQPQPVSVGLEFAGYRRFEQVRSTTEALSHPGTVKDQPTQLSNISRNTVRHHPKTNRQASTEVIRLSSGAGGARTRDQWIMSR